MAAPTISISASPTAVDSGAGSTLTWAVQDADSCQASGGWSGAKNISGSESTAPLTTDQTFALTCSGAGGTSTRQVSVAVREGPGLGVAISADPPGVANGASSVLTWSSNGADSCAASGAWSGPKALVGSESTGSLMDDATFTITCVGGSQQVMDMVTVSVRVARLSWAPPTENVDGTPVDLQGYTLYWGQTSRQYDVSVAIGDPNQTSYEIDVGPGTYYFALTSRAADGSESAYSNEVSKTFL